MPFVARFRTVPTAQWVVLTILSASLILLCDRGFDLSDESYYLFWIWKPEHFDASIHPFGFLLNPLSRLLDGSITGLRVFGVVFLVASAIFLGRSLAKYYEALDHRFAFDPRAIAAIFALANYAMISILTPSYNLLANGAGCLILGGAIGWAAHDLRAERRWSDIGAAILVGVGGCVAFFAKATFAALAAVAIAAHLMFIWRHQGKTIALRRAFATAIGCAVPLTSVVITTVGFPRFIQILHVGQATLNFGNNLASLPLKAIADLASVPLPLVVNGVILVLVVGTKTYVRNSIVHRGLVYGAAGLLVFDLYCVGAGLNRMVAGHLLAWSALVATAPALVLGLVIFGVARGDARDLTLAKFLPVAILFLLPFATAFGTANDFAQQADASLYATLLAGAIAADLLFPRNIAIAVQAAEVMYTTVLLLWSAHVPYRLPASFWAQTKALYPLADRRRLYVDAITRRYILGLRDIADREHLRPDIPIVDLSGGGPGTALFLNANAPFFPWIVPGYGNTSIRLADAAWDSLTPSEQRSAWIVTPIHPDFDGAKVADVIKRRKGEYRVVGHLPNSLAKQGYIEVWTPTADSSFPSK